MLIKDIMDKVDYFLKQNITCISLYTKESYEGKLKNIFRCVELDYDMDIITISLYPHHDSLALIKLYIFGENWYPVEIFDTEIEWLKSVFVRIEDKLGTSLFDDYWPKLEDRMTYSKLNTYLEY